MNVVRSWKDVTSNLEIYQFHFENFIILKGSDIGIKYDRKIIRNKYFHPTLDISYTPEELEQKEYEMMEIHQYIEQNQDRFMWNAEEKEVVLEYIRNFYNG